jgi:CBS domain-containing protein
MPRWRRLSARLLAPALWAAGLLFIVLGNAIGGLAFIMAGWFARVAARASRRREELEHLIDGVTVGEVMETEPFVVAPQATLDTFGDAIDATAATTVARVMRDDRLVGLVGPREVERVPRQRWAVVHASDAMARAENLPALAPTDALRPAADRLGASNAPGFPVLVDGRLTGILTRLAVGRTLLERETAARTGAEPGADPAKRSEGVPETGGAAPRGED